MKKLGGLILAGIVAFAATAFAQDFSSVTNVLGPGNVTNQVLRLEFPRTDLNVQVDGTQLDPNAGVETDLSFQQVTAPMLTLARSGRAAATTGPATLAFQSRTTAMVATGTTVGTTTGFASRSTTATTTRTTTGTTTGAAFTGSTSVAPTVTTPSTTTTTRTMTNLASLTSGQFIVTGDICVTDTEEPQVIDQLQKDGLAVTAIHEHLINETPDIRFVHVEGAGDGATLAQKLQNTLNIIGTPTATISTGSANSAQFADIMSVLGTSNANIEGSVIKYSSPLLNNFTLGGVRLNPGMGSQSEIDFQVESSSNAIVNADIVVEGAGAGPVIQSLRSNGFSVAALHNHTLDEVPRLFYVHAFGSGSQTSLAQAISQALNVDMSNLGARPTVGGTAIATGTAGTATITGTRTTTRTTTLSNQTTSAM